MNSHLRVYFEAVSDHFIAAHATHHIYVTIVHLDGLGLDRDLVLQGLNVEHLGVEVKEPGLVRVRLEIVHVSQVLSALLEFICHLR